MYTKSFSSRPLLRKKPKSYGSYFLIRSLSWRHNAYISLSLKILWESFFRSSQGHGLRPKRKLYCYDERRRLRGKFFKKIHLYCLLLLFQPGKLGRSLGGESISRLQLCLPGDYRLFCCLASCPLGWSLSNKHIVRNNVKANLPCRSGRTSFLSPRERIGCHHALILAKKRSEFRCRFG